MSKPVLSAHFESRKPSAVRLAQMKFDERKVKPEAVINVGIGNVSLPTNPAMMERMFALNAPDSPFGRPQLYFLDMPVRRLDAIPTTEVLLTT